MFQYGLFDVPDNLDHVGASDGDSDLEAELAAIAGGGGAKARPKPKPKPIPQVDLESLVADSLRDIPSDEEMSGTFINVLDTFVTSLQTIYIV